MYDIEYLRTCRLNTENGKNYGEMEYNLLVTIIGYFLNKITITPHIISEVWSLSHKKIPKNRFNDYFIKVIERFKSCDEENVPLKVLLDTEATLEFGFTDISLVEAARDNKALLLTDEDNLFGKYDGYIPITKFANVIACDGYLSKRN